MEPILQSAQAQFPPSANKTVRVRAAWKPSSGRTRPEPNGSDGWTPVGDRATRSVLTELKADGFTWVNLEAGGCANPFRDQAIDRLI